MDSIQLQMQALWITNNLAFLTRYWHTATAALKRVSEAPETFEEFKVNGVERPYVDAVISSHLDHHHYAAVLLAFASFEEFFSMLCGDLGKALAVTVEPTDLKDRGVQRFRKFIHKVCKVGNRDLQIDWPFLEQFAVVRNCLVHANGNRGRLADPRALDRVVAAYPAELSYVHDVKLRISDQFVGRVIRETERASLAVIHYLNAQSNQAMQPTEQAESEGAVFKLFAEAIGLPIEPGSIESRTPPEPDVRCTLVDAGPRCFELVEIIDSDLARAVGVQLKFQDRLLGDARERQLKALSDALVFVVFSRSSTNAQKQQACAALMSILEHLPAGVRGDIDPTVYPRLAGVVQKLRISRGDFPGPAFQVDGVTSISDPIIERIREKFAKTYATDAPIELLAYYRMHPTSRVEYELPGVEEFVQANLAASPFSCVWVFDADSRKLLYRSQ